MESRRGPRVTSIVVNPCICLCLRLYDITWIDVKALSVPVDNASRRLFPTPRYPKPVRGLVRPSVGNPSTMDPDRLWGEAMAAVQRDLDGDAMEEAHEVYVAEAGRIRLRDRRGAARMRLRGGREVMAVLAEDQGITDWLLAVDEGGATLAVSERAIVWMLGSSCGLRAERDDAARSPVPSERSLSSWLRDVWREGLLIRAGLVDGEQVTGTLTLVGADHVEVQTPDGSMTLPFAAVDLWSVRTFWA